MAQAIARRLLASIPVSVGATFVIFMLLHLGPGDPAVVAAGGEDAQPEVIEKMREELGLNDALLVQYGRMMGGVLTGDLGTSLFSSESVSEAILLRLPTTASLAIGGVLVGALFAIPLGMLAAATAGSKLDRGVIGFSTLGIASPQFFIGMMLAFALRETLLPVTGYRPLSDGVGTWLAHVILPILTLGIGVAAELSRHVRGSMLGVLDRQYIRTARAKGISSQKVFGKHALKNASLPVVTVLGLQFQALIAGTVTVEKVFGAPGLGSLLVRVAVNRDFPMIQGLLIFIVFAVVMVNILVDLLYTALNPKVRAV